MPQKELIRYIQQLSLWPGDYPHPSNRGVIDDSTPIVFSHLDYLSITFPYPDKTRSGAHRLPLPLDWFEVGQRVHGIKHWRQSAEILPAGRFYWNDGEKSAGSYAVFTGEDLALLRARTKLSDQHVLPRLLWNAKTVTRLDFCVNIDAGAVGDTRKEWDRGRAKTRVRKAWEPDVFAGGNGRTIYYGSEQSDKFLRVYDKARELKLAADVLLNRLELQTRHSVADRLSSAMLKHGITRAGKSAIRQHIDFPKLKWYQDALSGVEDLELQLTPAKQHKFMAWLNEQVLPGIAKRAHDSELRKQIADWLTKVESELAAHEGVNGGKQNEDEN